ncbi:MAG: OsmC family peroxiredoxin [Planctomycetota bacterium]|nr:MAG: OsmC family peroxiredoxin [Planctomycetota bacterium]
MKNGISLSGLSEFVHEVKQDGKEAQASYGVQLDWQSGTRSQVTALAMQLGRHRLAREFQWTIDEPRPLLGQNHGPNPQEVLLSGLGGCLLVAYAVGASVLGIQLEKLQIQVRGNLDLRGFLGVEEQVPVAFQEIEYQVHLAGDGSREQFEHLHRQVERQSPNRMSLAQGVPLRGHLTIEKRL